MASFPKTTPNLEVAKPGILFTKIVVLFILRPACSAISIVFSAHKSCLTNSNNFIIGTGLKKCMPITRSGHPEAAAISAIDRDDVLVASMQLALVNLPSCSKI